MNHAKALEALLFISGEPSSLREAAKLLGIDKKTLDEAIVELEKRLEGRGLCVLRHQDSVSLATAPDVAEVASRIAKERLEGDLSRSQLETLTIILWKGKVSRASIDYIRGVNSAFTLRSLLIRGLIERVHDAHDARVFLYSPTLDLYKYLGISSSHKLPEFETMQEKMKEYE